jgi:hypothetical protein
LSPPDWWWPHNRIWKVGCFLLSISLTLSLPTNTPKHTHLPARPHPRTFVCRVCFARAAVSLGDLIN